MKIDDIQDSVACALKEDLGDLGDITGSLVPADQRAKAVIICREVMVVCGQAWVEAVFEAVDADMRWRWLVDEGDFVEAQTRLIQIEGLARSLLKAERCALNFLQFLSGVATQTRRYVEVLAGTETKLLDTRKTIPGLRYAQKYAVHCGGGHNHRMGLFDAFLIKENHIAAAGSIAAVVSQARAQHPDKLLEVEVEDFDQLDQAIQANVDRIMLDNFSVEDIQRAVQMVAGRVALEVSGGVSLDNIHALAQTGVDFISVGALTKDVRAIDLSMRLI